MLVFVHLKGNFKNTLPASLGIGISLFVVLTSLGIANGLANNTLGTMLSIVPHIKLESRFGAIKIYDQEIDKLKSIEEISEIYPKISGKGMMKYKGFKGKFVEGVVIDAFRESDLEKFFQKYIIQGKIGEGILIGEELANAMLARVGDKIQIVSHENVSFESRIAAVFNTGFYDYDFNVLIIPFDLGKKFFKIDAATQIDVKVKDVYTAERLAQKISDITKLKASSWMSMNKQLLKGIALEKSVVILLEILFLILTGFVIFILISNIVRDKTKEIGILRAIGFSKWQISSSFILLSSIYSILGIIVGLIFTYLGYLVLSNYTFDVIKEVYYIPANIPFSISIKEILLVILGINVISFISALLPAIKAGNMDPVEALKYE